MWQRHKLNSSHCYARSTQPKKLGERGEGVILNTQGKSYQLIASTERQGSYFTIAACLHSIRALAVSFKNVLHTAQYHQEAKTLVRPGLSHTCKLTVTGGLQNQGVGYRNYSHTYILLTTIPSFLQIPQGNFYVTSATWRPWVKAIDFGGEEFTWRWKQMWNLEETKPLTN